MKEVKLVCFDLDDTLIRDIHSVMLPCILNEREIEHSYIQKDEEKGRFDCKTADFLRAELLIGLEELKLEKGFLDLIKPLANIKRVVTLLHQNDIKCIIITVGPKQVAKVACRLWDFDHYYGSNYEVINGTFTGQIRSYLEPKDKISCLKYYCKEHNIAPKECIAIGDGATDIPLFEFCGSSIALNSKPNVREYAEHSLETDDLMDILKYILKKK